MRFLNGLKTAIGVSGTLILLLLPRLQPSVIQAVGDQVYGVAQGVFGLFTALGLIHKVEKAKGAA